MSLLSTWAFLGVGQRSRSDPHVNPESQNCLLFWCSTSLRLGGQGRPRQGPQQARTELDQDKEVGRR